MKKINKILHGLMNKEIKQDSMQDISDGLSVEIETESNPESRFKIALKSIKAKFTKKF